MSNVPTADEKYARLLREFEALKLEMVLLRATTRPRSTRPITVTASEIPATVDLLRKGVYAWGDLQKLAKACGLPSTLKVGQTREDLARAIIAVRTSLLLQETPPPRSESSDSDASTSEEEEAPRPKKVQPKKGK